MADKPWFSGVFCLRTLRRATDFWIWVSALPPYRLGQMGIRPEGRASSKQSKTRKTRGVKKERKREEGKTTMPCIFNSHPNINQLPYAVLPFLCLDPCAAADDDSCLPAGPRFTGSKDQFPNDKQVLNGATPGPGGGD